jgi:hypothetical protein
MPVHAALETMGCCQPEVVKGDETMPGPHRSQ